MWSAAVGFALILSLDNTTPTLMVSETYSHSAITFSQLPWEKPGGSFKVIWRT